MQGTNCDQCFAGYLHSHSTADTQSQAEHRLPLLPDISMLSPELQQQWRVDKIIYLGAIKVKPHSAIKAVWECNKCPAGQPHIWTASVANRTRGNQCPYCCNRLVCLHNSLTTVAPDVAEYWNYNMNEKAPDHMLAGSAFRAEWKCPTCKCKWQAPIKSRACLRAGCPECSQALRVTQRQPTFAEAQPSKLAEWDFECNDAERFYPDDITLGSNRLVHWICSQCPKGKPHRWTASPYSRIGHGSGCPVCAGQQVYVCNTLQSLVPSVAAEFDVDKNGFAPSEITAHSHQKVWWRNARRGSWRQTVGARTLKRLPRIR